MTRLLLDTTFLIDADRAGDHLEEIIEDDDDVAIAAITVAEMQVGVLLSDGKRREARQAFVEDVLASIPVLEYDVDVAVVHADLLASVRNDRSWNAAPSWQLHDASLQASGPGIPSAEQAWPSVSRPKAHMRIPLDQSADLRQPQGRDGATRAHEHPDHLRPIWPSL